MIRAVLTDIEGTTTSLAFVKDVLFPYARKHLPGFIRSHAGDGEVRRLLEDVCSETAKAMDDEQAIAQLIQWIDEDRKVTPLKSLQGLIWEKGYRDGDYTGHVYEDAVQTLNNWHKQGIRLYIFSSGSVAAQKLLFGFSDAGDLTPLFSGYFDTRTGHKQEPASYTVIARQIRLAPGEILFLSDIAGELDAAAQAGYRTCQVVREGTLPSQDHSTVANLSEVDISSF